MADAGTGRSSGLGPHRRRTYPAQTVAPEDVGGTSGGRSRTVQEVLADIEGDPEAARAALDAEQASKHPRSTLVTALTAALAAAEPTPEPTTPKDGPPDASGEE